MTALLLTYGLDPEWKDKQGLTVMQRAQAVGQIETLHLLQIYTESHKPSHVPAQAGARVVPRNGDNEEGINEASRKPIPKEAERETLATRHGASWNRSTITSSEKGGDSMIPAEVAVAADTQRRVGGRAYCCGGRSLCSNS